MAREMKYEKEKKTIIYHFYLYELRLQWLQRRTVVLIALDSFLLVHIEDCKAIEANCIPNNYLELLVDTVPTFPAVHLRLYRRTVGRTEEEENYFLK